METSRDIIPVLAAEYVEEIIGAGFGSHMDATALADCIGRLVLGCFDPRVQDSMAPAVRTAVEFCLLTERTKVRRLSVDAETAGLLKEALSG